MKVIVLLLLALYVAATPMNMEKCFKNAQIFEKSFIQALEKRDTALVIDDLEKVFETYPNLLDSCGAEDKAEEIRSEIPPVCSKLLAKQAKLLVQIMRLYSEDKQKNEKTIILYTAMFETIYKTQVQKKCPFLKDVQMKEVKNKGECAEGMYQLSLTFEKLDMDLAAGKFNNSLTDMGKVVEKLPETLDSCSQHSLAKWVRNNFPAECLNSIGGLVRELATIEHNYTHLEWLKKHLKDFTAALSRVKAACPAVSL